jgi:hypothetical protein
MIWLNPIALVGLVAVLGPILIHLLRQPKASRVPFPTLRFVQPSRTVAARLRRLADPWLLVVRMAIVALAALALAQPVFLTPGRLEAWNARTARAIVVDASPAMERGGAAEAATLRADEEARTAYVTTVIEAPDLYAGVARAGAWLESAPPARREVVVISDFRVGTASSLQTDSLGGSVGLRAVQVGMPLEDRRFAMAPALDGWGAEVHLAVEITRVARSRGSVSQDGVRFLSADEAATTALLRAVTAAGTPAGDSTQPLAFTFRGAGLPPSAQPVLPGWMLAVAVRLAGDSDLQRAAASIESEAEDADEGPWFTVARGREGRPLVRAVAVGGELLIDVATDPRSYLAAAALRGALLARHEGRGIQQEEIVRLTEPALAALARAAGPVGRDAATSVERSDARWLWMLVLVLLAAESRIRRPTAARGTEAAARAA